MKQKQQPFHLSIGVKSLSEANEFFVAVLGGEVTHQDESGYVNIEVFGNQITLKDHPDINVTLPDFHFGFNMSLDEFNDLSNLILSKHRHCVAMEPKVVDAGTPMERKKMYLKSPSGYMIELKGYKK